MDFLIVVLSLLFALALFHGFSSLSRISKRLPPGPTPLPIIGNLHLLGAQTHKSLSNLAKTYGPIMYLKLGHITTVVISSPAIAKEVLQKHDLAFSSRCSPDALHANDQHKYSVVWLPVISSQWRSLRRILSSNIFSGNRLGTHQQLRSRKIQELISFCRKNSQTGEAVDIGQAAFSTSINLLSNIIFSKDVADLYSHSAKEFKDLIWSIMVEAGKPNLVDFFPMLERFDPQGIRSRMTIYTGKVLKLFDCLINERLEEQKNSQGVVKNDILDVILTTRNESSGEIDSTHLERLCLDLFVAGTETTSSTLEWAMAEILKNPKIMTKVKKELADVAVRGKPIKEADVASMPYLWCIVKETLRMHAPVPFITRKVEQDVEVFGHIIPKGSQVLVDAWAIGRDSNVWEDPLVFKPERFWNSEMDICGQDFELIPFGAGRRICPGLPLATRMIPLMLGSLLNSFDWMLEGSIALDQLDMEEKFGITLAKAHPLRAIPVSL